MRSRLPPLTLGFTSSHGIVTATFYDVVQTLHVKEHDTTADTVTIIDSVSQPTSFKLGEHDNEAKFFEWQAKVNMSYRGD